VTIMAFLTIAMTEILCRYKYRHDIEFIRDPDHRLLPNTAETNADGIRSEKEADDFEEEDLNIIILGDSFVYGWKQYPELAFPQQYERLVRSRHPECEINVANFGWLSSSPYLSLRLLKDIGRKYAPDVVILAIDMTDFHEDLKYRHLIERPTLIYKGLSYLPGVVILLKNIISNFRRFEWAQRLHEQMFGLPIDRFFIVNQPLRDTKKFGSAIFKSIIEIADFSKNKLNATFIALLFPRSFQYSDKESPKNWEKGAYEVLGPYSLAPFKLFKTLQDSVSFPVYSLLQDFQTTEVFPTVFYDDPHWTEKGLRFVAGKVYDISKKEDVLSCGNN